MGSESPPSDGTVMTDSQADETLERLGYGTLSLAHDDDAYGIPVSFGYDGDSVYLYLIRFGEDSEKIDYAESTGRASLTVLDVESRFDWCSVIVRGRLEETEDSAYAQEVIEDNAWHPSLFGSTSTEPMTEVRRMRLEVSEVTGRYGERYFETDSVGDR